MRASSHKYAVEDVQDLTDFYIKLPENQMAMSFPFELDEF
jgi:hypothetical protein